MSSMSSIEQMLETRDIGYSDMAFNFLNTLEISDDEIKANRSLWRKVTGKLNHTNCLRYRPSLIKHFTKLYLNNIDDKLLEKIVEVKKLDALTIENSNIEKITDIFSKMHNLRELAITYSNIKEIEYDFVMNKKLVRIKMSHNRIKEITDSFLRGMKMNHIDLTYNLISKFPQSFLERSGLEIRTLWIYCSNKLEKQELNNIKVAKII